MPTASDVPVANDSMFSPRKATVTAVRKYLLSVGAWGLKLWIPQSLFTVSATELTGCPFSLSLQGGTWRGLTA